MATRDLIFINAVKEGNLSAIIAIVEAGGEQYLDATTEVSRMTPLMYACEAGQLDIIKYFLSMGVSANTADRAGLTPLMHAVLCGDVEIVDYLVKQDLCPVDLTKKSKEKKTALDLALMNDFTAIARILRSPSLKEKKLTESSRSLVVPSYVVPSFAITYGGSTFPPVFNLTPEHSPSSSPLPDLPTRTKTSPPPQYGSFNWNVNPIALVESLAIRERSGSNGGSTNSDGSSLSKSSMIAENLLRIAGSSIASSDKSKGETMEKKNGLSIFTAAAKGKIRILRQFNPELLGSKDKRGRTPLMYAARHGKFLPVAYIVYRGVSLNDVDDTGNTALMRAAERGHRCVFQYLLIEGADTTLKNLQGQTAYDIAVRSRQLAIVDIMSEWSQMESKVLKTETKESKSLRFAVAPDMIPYVLFPEEEIDLALSTPPIPPVPPPPFTPSAKNFKQTLPPIPPFTGSSLSTTIPTTPTTPTARATTPTTPTSRPVAPGFPTPSSSSLSRLPSSVLNGSPPPLQPSTPSCLPSVILSHQSPPSPRCSPLPSSILSVLPQKTQSDSWAPPSPAYNYNPFLSHLVYEAPRKMSS